MINYSWNFLYRKFLKFYLGIHEKQSNIKQVSECLFLYFRLQVYIDWHPNEDRLGSIWCLKAGCSITPHDLKRNKWVKKELLIDGDLEDIVRKQFNSDKAAGNLSAIGINP